MCSLCGRYVDVDKMHHICTTPPCDNALCDKCHSRVGKCGECWHIGPKQPKRDVWTVKAAIPVIEPDVKTDRFIMTGLSRVTTATTEAANAWDLISSRGTP